MDVERVIWIPQVRRRELVALKVQGFSVEKRTINVYKYRISADASAAALAQLEASRSGSGLERVVYSPQTTAEIFRLISAAE